MPGVTADRMERRASLHGEIDHQLPGQTFQAGAQIAERDAERDEQARTGGEQRLRRHRRAKDIGLELLDVHAALGEDARNVRSPWRSAKRARCASDRLLAPSLLADQAVPAG
jgi:hypothetical protein